MVIKIINGNILESDNVIIVQQVNCQGVMGGGLAKQINIKYPEVPKEYKKYWSKEMKKISCTEELLGRVLYVDTFDEKIVANIFGQNQIKKGYNDKTVYTQEWALLKGIEEVKNTACKIGASVAIPTYIGCGLANGDWGSIKPKIEQLFIDSSVEVSFYHYR